MKVRVDTSAAASEVRRRYLQALERGMSHEAATDYANGRTVELEVRPRREKQTPPAPVPMKDTASVEIPDNWRSLSWPQRKSLASRVTDMPIINGDDANAAIELELERRQGG